MSTEEKKKDSITTIMDFLRERYTDTPDIGIICGSGLGALTESVQRDLVLHYSEIPGFPLSTVVGHAGELVFGTLGNKKVVCMRGRFHPYEGYSPQTCVIGVRVMAALGVRMMIVTNAAGGINRSFNIGDVMIMTDHISFPGMAGNNPLSGPNDARFGPRFPSMFNAYDPALIELSEKIAGSMDDPPRVQKGAYVAVNGPSYETPHEISLLRTLGADTVGMSTVHEVTVARHSGIKCLGFSLVTNRCLGVGDTGVEPTHQEVIDSINAVQVQVESLVKLVVDAVDLTDFPVPQAAAHFARS